VLNLDIKRSVPEVVAYEETLAGVLGEHGRQDDVIVGIVLGRGDGKVRQMRTWHRHLGRHRGDERVLPEAARR